MRRSRTRIVLVSERVGPPRAGGVPHPQLRGLLARDYASFTEPAAPPHDLVSPATTAVGIVVKLNDSDWRPPEFLIGARDFCIRSRIPVGDSAHPNMQHWLTPLGAYRLLGGRAHGRPQRPSRRPDRRAGRRHPTPGRPAARGTEPAATVRPVGRLPAAARPGRPGARTRGLLRVAAAGGPPAAGCRSASWPPRSAGATST
jgi:hypothetical protein